MQTLYSFLADAIVLLHLLFIVFVVSGGFLALKWRQLVYVHLPAVVWGVYIEFTGKICPLTPLENRYRLLSGELGYEGGFIERYLIPVIYPVNLTRDIQIALGFTALLINVGAYAWLVYRWRKRG